MAKIAISDLRRPNDQMLSSSDTFLSELSENESASVFGGNPFKIFATTLLKAFAAYLIYLIITDKSST
ncbi:hypothetical protein WA1_40060 [Scytonema hofmannii PCC 7110]|uniref:Uncharacterized protein n=1 Tax=Scytonema hofmannii PCC 7110 TaxID=128403 RepID=A0A139WYZ6_9CYAN|nr:hypothetical protein [Scytonema hofmannii]KYC37658.1 hypothetical protein WA1_40060 [Scytonema hofmannii PCC 7110]